MPSGPLQRSPAATHPTPRHPVNLYLDEGGRVEASPPQPVPLAKAQHVSISGQAVTLDREPGRGWVATGWEGGLPVARTPITEAEAARLLERFPGSVVR
jgi:hypothetical protein